MGKALTAITIEKMQSGPSRREVPDGLVSGLYLVVQPSGAKSWAVRYRAAGTPRKHTLGAFPAIDLKAARDLAQRALVDVAKGSDPSATKKAAKLATKAPADRGLVEKVVDTFIERHVKPNTKVTSARETERILKREVVGTWKGRMLASVTRADVHDLLDTIVDRGAPIQANRVLASLRRMCGWAVERGIIETSPCEKVKAPTAERSRDRVLGDDELKAVWAACDGIGWPFGPLVRMLLLTGQRRDEVGSMKWSEVDLDAKLWTIPRERAKNGQAHPVPLSEPVLAILRALPRVGEHVFSTNGRTAVSGFSKIKAAIDNSIENTRRDAGALLPWVFHDLRRTAASGMARLGITLPAIEKVLNHVSGSFGGIVGVYQKHSFADEKRHALEAWGGFIQRLVADRPADNVVEMRAVS